MSIVISIKGGVCRNKRPHGALPPKAACLVRLTLRHRPNQLSWPLFILQLFIPWPLGPAPVQQPSCRRTHCPVLRRHSRPHTSPVLHITLLLVMLGGVRGQRGDTARSHDAMVEHWLDLVQAWGCKWAMENPVGSLRFRPFMQRAPAFLVETPHGTSDCV